MLLTSGSPGDVSEELCSFSNLSVTSQLILQPFRHITYVTTQSTTLPLLQLRHSSFYNPSVALPTSQLNLQPFRCFTFVTVHSTTLPSLYLRHNSIYNLPLHHLRHSSFYNPSVALPTSQLNLQPFRFFTYVTAHSSTLPSLYLRHNSIYNLPLLHLRHSSFYNPSVALPTSQLNLQPFRRFTYVTAQSPTLPLLLLRLSSFSNPSFASPTSQALHLRHLARTSMMLFFHLKIYSIKIIKFWQLI